MSDLLDKKCTIEKCCICAKCCLYYPPNVKRDFVLAKPNLIKWRLNNNSLSLSASNKALMLDILKRYSTGEIVESGEQKEKEMMGVSIKTVDIEKEKEAAREEGYKQGLEEAWEIARKIELCLQTCGYTHSQLMAIFNSPSPNDILEKFSIHEVKEKIAAYEAEQAKPKLEDVVKCIRCGDDFQETGIIIIDGANTYTLLCQHDVKNYTVVLHKRDFVFEKTGKHFDIQSMLDEIG